MAQQTFDPEETAKADTPTPVVGRRHDVSTPWRRVWRYSAMPLFLIVIFAGLYVWVQGQELDSITRRALTPGFLRSAVFSHLYLAGMSTLFVIALAIPTGIACTRPGARRIRPFAIGLANMGQATPSIGLITLIVLAAGTGPRGVIVGLVAYSFLPILRNTIAGLEAVEPALIESARGMGMSRRAVLRRIELPLAVPVMLAGIRVALILNVGTASLAFLFAAGGLGEVIFTGFQLRRLPVLVTGAVMASGLALLIDYLAGVFEDLLKPKGL
ncbi:ABC transporter permease [soil metagenome]